MKIIGRCTVCDCILTEENIAPEGKKKPHRCRSCKRNSKKTVGCKKYNAHVASNAQCWARRLCSNFRYEERKEGKDTTRICEVCGSDYLVVGHHDDYSKPWVTRNLCDPCHKDWHKKNEAVCADLRAPIKYGDKYIVKPEVFAANIRVLRSNKKLSFAEFVLRTNSVYPTVEDFANAVGVNWRVISQWITGKKKPDLSVQKMVRKIGTAYSRTVPKKNWIILVG